MLLVIEYINYIVYMIMYIHVYIRTFFDKLRLRMSMVNIAHRLSMFHQNNSFKHPIDIFENNLCLFIVHIICLSLYNLPLSP